jgi:hypothetical protein
MAHINRFPLVSLLALGIAMPAMAQNTAQPSGPQTAPQTAPQDENQPRGDVVVVTAQKREETVQDIAIAVTAITSELRDEIGLTTVQDYTNFAPGLSYSTSNDRLGMRGVTRTSNNFGIRSGISNYVDGVYFSSAIPASREPILVERVEVVRGPQGTLYGRVNRILDLVADNGMKVRVDTGIDAQQFMVGLQKVANRVTTGLVLAALIVGAALLMSVQTEFRIFGYPGLAMLCFTGAAIGGVVLLWESIRTDAPPKENGSA